VRVGERATIRQEKRRHFITSQSQVNHKKFCKTKDKTTRGKARQGKKRQGKTRTEQNRTDKTRQDKTRSDQTRPDQTRQNKTRQDQTRQDKTRQGKTRHSKTREKKTRQDKTRQDKTRQPHGQSKRHEGTSFVIVGKGCIRCCGWGARVESIGSDLDSCMVARVDPTFETVQG
jgi:hypothetical protein